MRFHLAPEPLLFLITTLLLQPQPIAANPQPVTSSLGGYTYNELFARWDCDSGTTCGWKGQYCCSAGSGCHTYYTGTKTIAECTPKPSGWASISAAPSGSAAPKCNYALSASRCGNTCCQSDEYCAQLNTCSPAYGKKTTTTKTNGGAGPGLKGTSLSSVVVTQTATQSGPVPYITPAAGGGNVTMERITGGSSLSGGAIAGIVVGVLIGLLILGVICFYCCIKGLFDGILAIFGGGRKRKVTEVDEYTRRTHHSSGGVQRTWYGAPVKRKKVKEKDSHLGRDLLGWGAGLAGLWAILGLKRRREDRRRNEEKYSEYSYSSDYYTSESSASSDDRRSGRYTHSVRRSGSRRP